MGETAMIVPIIIFVLLAVFATILGGIAIDSVPKDRR